MAIGLRYLVFVTASAWTLSLDSVQAAESTLSADVDALLAEYDFPESPGGAIGVFRNGESVYERGFGSAHLDHRVPNSPQTIFDVGSVAKSFTCACIAILLDRGHITPEDDIRKYLPEMHAFETPVRIRDLVRCESGVWAQWHIAQLAGWSAEPIETPYTERDFLTLLAGQRRLPFEPGTQFRYGTGDYFLLGLIVRRVTGQSLAEFAKKELFEPLGMTNTFIMEHPARVVPHRAVGYHRDSEGRWLGWSQASSAPGGRGLYTSLKDLQHWQLNFFDNRLPEGPHLREFIDDGTLLGNRNVLDARPTGSYRGLKRIQFTGGMPGFATTVTLFPEHQFAVICLCNNGTIRPWELNARVAELWLSDHMREPAPNPDNDSDNRQHDVEQTVRAEDLLDKVVDLRLGDDGRIWRTVLRDDRLVLIDHLNQVVPLVPMGNNRFRPDGGFFHESARLVFQKSSDDTPYTVESRWVGGTLHFETVELVHPTADELEAYEGQYYSDELATFFHLRVEEAQLMLRVNNLGWQPLDPTVRDEFIPGIRQNHDNRIFRFLRNEQQQVIGLAITLWRVQGLRFEKVAD